VPEEYEDWEIPLAAQPRPRDYGFDLERALSSVVELDAIIPPDAFTASVLGTERSGSGVVIRDDGVVLTIGYLITEADEVMLTTNTGREVAGHVLAYDAGTGFGLVQALDDLGVPAIPLGDSRHSQAGEPVVVGGAGGRRRSLAARIVARQEFAGYWEYVLDEAIFTAPAHPLWGGSALIDAKGELIGIGSLQLQHRTNGGRMLPLNMMVPIELLHPIYDDLLAGRTAQLAKPWLGLYAQEVEDKVVVVGFAGEGPAHRAGLQEGDVILKVGDLEITNLADLYRGVWAAGPPGAEVGLTVDREGDVFAMTVRSADRNDFLKVRRLH
jgi:S1-C subfamily serine protease